MKSTLRRLTQTLLLLAVGVGLYVAMPIARRFSESFTAAPAPEGPLATVDVEGAASAGTAGNIVLQNCLVALERRQSIAADVIQSGTIAGERMTTSGGYLQQGRAEDRQFSLLLQGRIGPSTARLWQVCTGRWLWTDLAWDSTAGAQQGDSQGASRRSVQRIDLGEVRRKLTSRKQTSDDLSPGQARAELIHPELWSGMGGLPMLVGALNENFNFGTPRQMSLRNMRVYATIGTWKPQRLAALLGESAARESEDGEADPTQPNPNNRVELPDRIPHHVLVAIGADDLFPHLIEYRSNRDSLSAGGVPEDGRFRESDAPLMKLDFMQLRFNEPIPADRFVYNPPEGENWQDTTDRRLAQIAGRMRAKQLATRPPRRQQAPVESSYSR